MQRLRESCSPEHSCSQALSHASSRRPYPRGCHWPTFFFKMTLNGLTSKCCFYSATIPLKGWLVSYLDLHNAHQNHANINVKVRSPVKTSVFLCVSCDPGGLRMPGPGPRGLISPPHSLGQAFIPALLMSLLKRKVRTKGSGGEPGTADHARTGGWSPHSSGFVHPGNGPWNPAWLGRLPSGLWKQEAEVTMTMMIPSPQHPSFQAKAAGTPHSPS